MSFAVTLIAGQARYSVSRYGDATEPTIVPAANLVLEIEGPHVPAAVHLDGRELRLSLDLARTRGVLAIDTFRSVGFHRLDIAGDEFLFGTSDAKLGLEGVHELLTFVEREGLSWGGQLAFADGVALRDPRVDFAWLSSSGRRSIEACRQIAERPIRSSVAAPREEPPRTGPLAVQNTLALLRQDPVHSLEEHPLGLLMLEGKRYFPRRVVTLKPSLSINGVGNRRAAALLRGSRDIAQSVLADPTMTGTARSTMQSIVGELDGLLAGFPFAAIQPSGLPPTPSREEVADPRYQETFEFYRQLVEELGWLPGTRVARRFAYVSYADQIYQAFAALAMAEAFDMKLQGVALSAGLRVPAFRSEVFDFYYDTSPPSPEFSSWRETSLRPGDPQPDYCIVDRTAGRGILGDAKYRVEKSGSLPSSAIADCQVYMQSFNRHSFFICYPGPQPGVETIAGEGNDILAVAVGPFPGLIESLRRTARPLIEGLMEPSGDLSH